MRVMWIAPMKDSAVPLVVTWALSMTSTQSHPADQSQKGAYTDFFLCAWCRASPGTSLPLCPWTLFFCMRHTRVGQLQECEFVLYSETLVILMASCNMCKVWCIFVALLALSRNKNCIKQGVLGSVGCSAMLELYTAHEIQSSGERLSSASRRLACASQSILSQVFLTWDMQVKEVHYNSV